MMRFKWFRRRCRTRKHTVTIFAENAKHAAARRASFKIRRK